LRKFNCVPKSHLNCIITWESVGLYSHKFVQLNTIWICSQNDYYFTYRKMDHYLLCKILCLWCSYSLKIKINEQNRNVQSLIIILLNITKISSEFEKFVYNKLDIFLVSLIFCRLRMRKICLEIIHLRNKNVSKDFEWYSLQKCTKYSKCQIVQYTVHTWINFQPFMFFHIFIFASLKLLSQAGG
jgi:hypothetical protein